LQKLVRQIHSITAREINKLDGVHNRKIWHNYWDTCITHETSYLARLRYVHFNPIKHGIEDIEGYPYCSYHWFLQKEDEDFKVRILNQPIDRLNIEDDF
jgi:putative transposase